MYAGVRVGCGRDGVGWSVDWCGAVGCLLLAVGGGCGGRLVAGVVGGGLWATDG